MVIIYHLAFFQSKTDAQRYCVAAQDEVLLKALREIAGVPVFTFSQPEHPTSLFQLLPPTGTSVAVSQEVLV